MSLFLLIIFFRVFFKYYFLIEWIFQDFLSQLRLIHFSYEDIVLYIWTWKKSSCSIKLLIHWNVIVFKHVNKILLINLKNLLFFSLTIYIIYFFKKNHKIILICLLNKYFCYVSTSQLLIKPSGVFYFFYF